MTASPSIDLSGWMSEQLTKASPDLLRAMTGAAWQRCRTHYSASLMDATRWSARRTRSCHERTSALMRLARWNTNQNRPISSPLKPCETRWVPSRKAAKQASAEYTVEVAFHQYWICPKGRAPETAESISTVAEGFVSTSRGCIIVHSSSASGPIRVHVTRSAAPPADELIGEDIVEMDWDAPASSTEVIQPGIGPAFELLSAGDSGKYRLRLSATNRDHGIEAHSLQIWPRVTNSSHFVRLTSEFCRSWGKRTKPTRLENWDELKSQKGFQLVMGWRDIDRGAENLHVQAITIETQSTLSPEVLFDRFDQVNVGHLAFGAILAEETSEGLQSGDAYFINPFRESRVEVIRDIGDLHMRVIQQVRSRPAHLRFLWSIRSDLESDGQPHPLQEAFVSVNMRFDAVSDGTRTTTTLSDCPSALLPEATALWRLLLRTAHHGNDLQTYPWWQ